MLSPVTPNSLLKMHWSPEHGTPLSPWAEQHLDVSSTTSPPAGHHKHHHDPYGARRPPAAGYAPAAGAAAGYPWASDDISALTASSLLKRYAEKYSGLELPYDSRGPPLASGASYTEPGPYLKTEPEPWGAAALGQGGVECYPGLEALAGAKVGPGAAGGVAVVVSDAGYSGGSCSSVSPQDYPPVYNGTSYLPAGYCPQPSAALPPGPLHALQSGYGSSTTVYNYPPGCYPPHPQTYSHPSASYLSGPPPLGPRPTVVGGSGYGYSSSTSHTSLGGGGSPEGGAPLKRKAFEMSEDVEDGGGEEEASRYRKYGNGHGSGHGGNKSHGNGHQGNGHYDMGSPPAPPDPQAYKSGGKPLMSPPYGGAGDYSPTAAGGGLSGESGGGSGEQHGFPPQQRMTVKMPASHTRSEDPTGGC